MCKNVIALVLAQLQWKRSTTTELETKNDRIVRVLEEAPVLSPQHTVGSD